MDPGSQGTAYSIRENRRVSYIRFDLLTEEQIRDWFEKETEEAFAFLERTGSHPGDSGKTMFKAGDNVGLVRGIMLGLHIPFMWIDPIVWQPGVGVGGIAPGVRPGMTKGQRKACRDKFHQATARELFPNIPFTLDSASGILIAEYGWRKRFGGKKYDTSDTVDSGIRPGRGVIHTVTRVRRRNG